MSELLDIAARIAGEARPGEQVEVYVSRSRDTDIRVYDGAVETLSSAASSGVGIRVVANGRQGFAYAGSLDGKVVAGVLADARDNVQFATPDDHVATATPDGVDAADLQLWDGAVDSTPTDAKVELTLQLEAAVRSGDRRIRQVASADYGDAAVEWAVATSTGIAAATRRTVCSLSVSAIAGDGADSHTGVGLSFGRGPGDLNPQVAAADAIERATRLLGATRPRSGRCVVVLDPRVTSTVLGAVSAALNGEAVTKGRSFFAERVGEQVAVGGLTLVDDPTNPQAFSAAAFDAEGLACRRNVLVDRGVLRGFVFDTTSARRAGTASTASAVRGGYATVPTAGCRALLLAPGPLTAEEIVAAVGDGLYVQSVSGVHSGVNPVSGDFSVGAEGVMVRHGQLAEPVREVTIASTLQRMLQSVLHVGSDVHWLPGRAAGQTVAVEAMSLSGA